MHQRTLLLAAGAAAVFSMGFTGAKYKASVHPSVFEHMDLARSKAASGRQAEAVGYAEALLMTDVIKVGVDLGSTPQKQIAEADGAVQGAIAMWDTALEGKVKFTRVPLEQADVKIHFDSDVRLQGQIVSGYVNWTRSIKYTPEGIRPSFKGDVYLRTTDPRGRLMTQDAMRHTCGHEFGHIFGLDDNPSVGTLMGPLDLRRPVAKPTPAEVDTVKSIREECETIITQARATVVRGTHACRFDGTCTCGCCGAH